MMKKLTITFSLVIAVTILAITQPPQAFKYQAVVHDNTGEILQNQEVGIRISIHDETAGGTIVYQETFTESTNDFGLLNIEIGTGTTTIGNFHYIDWENNSKYLELEIDPDGSTNYTSIGTSKIVSVPYALLAKNVANPDDGDWTTSGNDLYAANSGKVGIGTSYPDGKLSINAPSGTILIPSTTKGLVIKDGLINSGNEFEITEYLGTPKFRVLDNGYTIVGADSKGIQMRTDGLATDIESLGADLAINYQTGNNTLLNVTSGNVGIGTNSPTKKLEVQGSDIVIYAENTSNGNYAYLAGSQQGVNGNSTDGSGVIGYSQNYIGVFGNSFSGKGIYGSSATGLAGDFNGNVNITGSLSKGSGSFVIDHPLDPENKLLRHNFVESPENLLIYRGKIQLNENGEALVEMPEYFIALTKEDEASIQLTPIGKPSGDTRYEFSYEWLANFDSFSIYGEPGRQISWMVLPDRDDPVIHQLARPVEEEKGGNNNLCEKGKLLYPKAYDYPESAGKDYEINIKTKESNSK